MENLLTGLRAAGEETRLRLLAICAHGELTVSELTQILGQSQPRVSRHLKLLCDAGLLDRFREGSWVFYRLSEKGPTEHLARTLVDLISADDTTLGRDLARLEAVKRARQQQAAAYFRANAARWNEIRSLYAPEEAVERALLAQVDDCAAHDYLDIGTGTGRILELLAPKVDHGLGIDLSVDMLAVARTTIEKANLRHCQVRQGDMYNLPLPDRSVDLITLHQVLHYADDPASAIAEAARVLRPPGRVVIVDFLPHQLEFLRTEHAHRRLGFSDEEVQGWLTGVNLTDARTTHVPGDPLTVGIWTADAATKGARQ